MEQSAAGGWDQPQTLLQDRRNGYAYWPPKVPWIFGPPDDLPMADTHLSERLSKSLWRICRIHVTMDAV